MTVASELPSTFEGARPGALWTLDIRHPERAADQARVFAREHPIAAVVGVDDDTAVAAAAIAAALALGGNPVPAAVAARDKHRQRVVLAAGGVPVPGFALHHVDEDAEALGRAVPYPCVLKPLRLSASRGVIRADDLTGFVAAFRRLKAILESCEQPDRELLVEDYVSGTEVALEGLIDHGRLQVLAIFDKPDPLVGPFFEETIYVTPSRLPRDAQASLASAAERAAQALGLVTGPIHAELRWNERGPWLIELAARPIGGRCSAALRFMVRETGNVQRETSLEELILRQALGLPLDGLQREARAAGVMMIPIPRRGVLREVRGVEAARAVPLIEDVAITIPPGQEVVPLPEASRYLGFIFARGEYPAEVEEALREAHRRLRFVIEPVSRQP